MNPIRKLAASAVSVIALTGCCTGCSPDPTPASSPDKPSNVVIVVGNHANAPMPALLTRATTLVHDALASGGRVDLVAGDSSAQVRTFETLRMKPVKGTPGGKANLLKGNLKKLAEALQESPSADGLDDWAAIRKAQVQLASVGGANPTIIVVDSGLNDRGVLSFARPGAIAAHPLDVAGRLRSAGQLLPLRGTRVLLQSVGATVAPQQTLCGNLVANVTQIYVKALEASGASVDIDGASSGVGGVDPRGHAVTPVPVAPCDSVIPGCTISKRVFDDNSAVRFRPGEAEFLSKPAAEKALAPIATWLADGERRAVVITGTTARYASLASQVALATQRAEVVRRYFLSKGVRDSQMQVRGVGSHFDAYENDRAPGGGLLPGPASRNRAIRLQLTDRC